jgi:hypothetical protein
MIAASASRRRACFIAIKIFCPWCESEHTDVQEIAILKAKLLVFAEYRMPYQIAFAKHHGVFIRLQTI